MMSQKYNDIKTNEAWNRLYSRLSEDGLLYDKDLKKSSFVQNSAFRWAAGIAVICISATILFFIANNNNSHKNMQLLSNTTGVVTLATTLEDGSIVYLANQASLHFPEHFEKHKREVFLEGNAMFDVSGNKKRPFIIETERVRIEVLGTMFNIKNTNSFSLSVQRGQVQVTLKSSGQSVLVQSGETVRLDADQLQTALTSDNDYLNYMEQIQFKDERLVNVVDIINRNSELLQLEIAPELADRLLTVTFSNDSPSSMAQLICMALNLQYTQQQNTIYISELNTK